jgi:hypothetical protein
MTRVFPAEGLGERHRVDLNPQRDRILVGTGPFLDRLRAGADVPASQS